MTHPDPLRTVFERFPYGVFVVAAKGTDDEIAAIIATWVMQVSFSPPLIGVSLEKDGQLTRLIGPERSFTVSLVPRNGTAIAKEVLKAGPGFSRRSGMHLFSQTARGIPHLVEHAGVLECRTLHVHEAGDHLLAIAVVTGCEPATAVDMLTLKDTGWKYRKKNQKSAT